MSAHRSVTILAMLVALLGRAASGQEPEEGAPPHRTLRTVSVTGVGSIRAMPDRAVLSIGVRAEAKSAVEAMTKAGERMAAVLEQLKRSGIPDSDLRTELLRLDPIPPERAPNSSAPKEPAGFVASHLLQATVNDPGRAGEFVDLALRAGADRIEGIRFVITHPEELLTQARKEAMARARRAAAQLAEAGGASLGEVLTIREESTVPAIARSALVPLLRGAITPIEPGLEAVTVTVQVTWQLRMAGREGR